MDGSRLARAGVFTVLVFALAGGGAGFVVAADDGQPDLFVPLPRPGDRAAYEVTETRVPGVAGAVTNDIALREAFYEWLPERIVVDRAFAERPSHPLQSTFVFEDHGQELRRVEVVDFDPITGEAMRTSISGNFSVQPQLLPRPYTGLDTGIAALQPAIDVQWAADRYGSSVRVPCGMRTPLHGSNEIQPVTLLGDCGSQNAPKPGFAPAGWEDVGQSRAYRFDAVESPAIRVWYDGHAPFPARFTSALPQVIDTAHHVGLLFTMERTAWARGADDYPTHEAGVEALARPVVVAPLVPGPMLDDEGLGDELPLSRAYAEVERAPRTTARTSAFGPLGLAASQPSVREWQAAHPDGYLAYAARWESHDWYGQVNPYWSMLWVGGDEWLGKVVSWEPSQEDPFSVHLPDASGRRIVIIDWWPSSDPEALREYVRGFPPPSLGVANLPPAAAVAERFHGAAPDAQTPSYGFRFMCHDSCTRSSAVVWAGTIRTTFSSITGGVGGTATYESLTIDDAGLTVERYRQVSDSPPILGLGAPPKDEAPPTQEGADSLGTWVWPSTPRAATGISLLAILAGALYYFWPTAKGTFGLGLFSRINDSAVLDQATRRRIFEAIRSEPGIHFMALARKSDLGRGALDHHLRKLAAAEMILVRKTGGYTCYFPRSGVSHDLADGAAALRSAGSRAVFDAVRAAPGTSCRELARRLGRAPSTVSYHLQRLQEAGLVLGASDGAKLSPLGERVVRDA